MKKRAPKGWVKISEFARLTGVSDKTISAVIKRGSIPAECCDRVGTAATAPYYLDPKKAALAWVKAVNVAHPQSRPVYEILSKYISTFDPEFGKRPSVEVATAVENLTLADAQLKERIAKAKIAELELKEKEGELVQKEMVESELFSAGQELRNALLAIPDRIVDQIISESDNRNKVHNTLYDAIASELEKLADINTRIS